MRVFVISLAKSDARRARMRKLLGQTGMNVEFVNAQDGRELTDEHRARYDHERALLYYGSRMSDAEIGCFISHYRIFEQIVREGLDWALVLEDDVEIDDRLAEVCSGVIAALSRFDIVRLHATRSDVLHPTTRTIGDLVANLTCGGAVYRIHRHILGACGYLVSQAGARKMIEAGDRIFLPIDHLMDRFWENGVEPLLVRPCPVRQSDNVPSEIGVRGSHLYGRSTGLVALRRRLKRASDSIAKRVFVAAYDHRLLALLLTCTGSGTARRARAARLRNAALPGELPIEARQKTA